MCGIIGYIGKKPATPIIIEGLKRLEYRGYDSAGIAVDNGGRIEVLKDKGRVESLAEKLGDKNWKGTTGCGHSRWATHGAVTKTNAHPHWDCQRNIFLVHNGIIENYRQLKKWLGRHGHRFRSETDTEVLAHLIEHFFKRLKAKTDKPKLEDAVRVALKKAKGAYAVVVIAKEDPEKIVLARLSSPLLIGVGKGENIVASDVAAVVRHTRRIVYLDDGEIGVVTKNNFEVTSLSNKRIEKEINDIDWDVEEAQRGGYPHFMLKEIYDEPEAVENALRGRTVVSEGLIRLGGVERVKQKLKQLKRLIVVGMGTAYYAGMVGEYLVESIAGIPVEVEYASEFRYREPVIDKGTAVLAVSQSGETIDTLEAVREAKRKGALTLGIVNVVGSTIARETDAGIYNHAGPEIGVASTKAFVSQLTVFVLLALMLGRERNLNFNQASALISELKTIPSKMRTILKESGDIEKTAKKYARYHNFLYLGRKFTYPVALEGALKLKEISYIHAEGYSSAEMKHGPIALIEPSFPTLALALRDSVYDKNLSNIAEIKARQGKVIAVATKGDKAIARLVDDILWLPKVNEKLSPLLSIVPLHLFAYYIGVAKGRDIDKPRNLAKSVTVE